MQIKFGQKLIDFFRFKLDKEMIRQHYNKFIQLQYYQNTMETLILGSSHGDYGYLASENEFNLALPSQDLYNSYKLYEKYSKSAKLKNVIIFYSVFSEGFILDKTNAKEISLSYKNFFGINILHDSLFLRHRNLFFPWYFMQIVNNKISFNNGNNSSVEDTSQALRSSISPKERALAHLKSHNRPNKQIKYLHKLVDLCHKNSHNVFIVIAPATREYKENLPDGSFIFASLKEFNDVEIIDLYDSDLFNDDDFLDWDHLNLSGAKKCTKYIKNVIYKANKNN